MNNNIPIARWLSMFWLCSAVSLLLGQFGGSVTSNGTNGAALTVTGILGIFCTLVQFYPFLPVQPRVRAPAACVHSQLCSAYGGNRCRPAGRDARSERHSRRTRPARFIGCSA